MPEIPQQDSPGSVPVVLFPSPTSETPPPPEEPEPNDEVHYYIKRKAYLATGLVTLVMIGIIWYDPFQLFNFDVGVSRDKASEVAPTLIVRNEEISLVCGRVGKNPVVRISWKIDPRATNNGIERNVNGSAFTPIFIEGENGDSPFQVFTFRDTFVQFNQTYQYRIIGEQPSGVSATVLVSEENCK